MRWAKLQRVCEQQGVEFTSNEFDGYCKEHGRVDLSLLLLSNKLELHNRQRKNMSIFNVHVTYGSLEIGLST